MTEQTLEVSFVAQSDTGERPAEAAPRQGRRLAVGKRDKAKRDFAWGPRRWGVEHSLAGVARCQHWARDDERVSQTLAGLHVVVFTSLMPAKAAPPLYLDSALPIMRRNPRRIIGPETGQDVPALRPFEPATQIVARCPHSPWSSNGIGGPPWATPWRHQAEPG